MWTRVHFWPPVIAVLYCMGCTAGRVSFGQTKSPSAQPVTVVKLVNPVAAICADQNRLVVLEASGGRILLLDSLLFFRESIILEERLPEPRGVGADRFYYYVYDEQVLYRMQKHELKLTPWLSRIRVSGLASFAPGELLVSDGERKAIWYKGLFGESRRFLDATSVSRPGPLVSLVDHRFCVLDAGSRLVYFNRVGVITDKTPLTGEYDLLSSDGQNIYLAGFGTNSVTVFAAGRLRRYELEGATGVRDMAVVAGRLVILDADLRSVLLYYLH